MESVYGTSRSEGCQWPFTHDLRQGWDIFAVKAWFGPHLLLFYTLNSPSWLKHVCVCLLQVNISSVPEALWLQTPHPLLSVLINKPKQIHQDQNWSLIQSQTQTPTCWLVQKHTIECVFVWIIQSEWKTSAHTHTESQTHTERESEINFNAHTIEWFITMTIKV